MANSNKDRLVKSDVKIKPIPEKVLRPIEVLALVCLVVVTVLYTSYNKGLWDATRTANNKSDTARMQQAIEFDSAEAHQNDRSRIALDSAKSQFERQLHATEQEFALLNAPIVVLDSLTVDTSHALPDDDVFTCRFQNFGKTSATISNDEVAFSDSLDFINALDFKAVKKIFIGGIGPSELAPGQYFKVDHQDMLSYLRDFMRSKPFEKYITVIVHFEDALRKNRLHLESYTHDPVHPFLTLKNITMDDTSKGRKAQASFPKPR